MDLLQGYPQQAPESGLFSCEQMHGSKDTIGYQKVKI